MASTILLVDDEPQILDVLSSYLKADGFHVLTTGSGVEAVDLALSCPIALIVLDLMLPDKSGEDVCREIRGASRVPILMLTAKSGEEDRIKGLGLGADDYLVKPFSPRELVARVRAILRRTGDYQSLSDTIRVGEIVILLDEKRVLKRDQEVMLTPSEYRLLSTLARYPGKVWSREELVAEVLGIDYAGNDRTIDTHVKNLRQKLEDDPKHPTYLKSVYGMGYRLDSPKERNRN